MDLVPVPPPSPAPSPLSRPRSLLTGASPLELPAVEDAGDLDAGPWRRAWKDHDAQEGVWIGLF
jgi:hypothetical protein